MAGELITWIGCALLVSVAVSVEGDLQPCTVGNDPCQCQHADGHYLDINPIGTSFTQPFAGITDYSYVYGPCGHALNEGDECTTASNVAVCQQAGTWYNVGEYTNVAVQVDLSANPVYSVWSYTGGDGGRETHVTITCQDGSIPGSIVDNGENPDLTYNLAVTSGVGCIKNPGTEPKPPGPTGPSPTSSGISAGSITCIIFFVSCTIYIVGGVLLMRFHRGAQGLEMIPNRDLWFSVPGLIKDGAYFTVSPCRGSGGGGGGGHGEYEKL